MKNIFTVFVLLLVLNFGVFAQSTTISAGGSGNIQLPTLSNTQIVSFTNPQLGMMVFDKTYNVVRVFNGTGWVCLTCPAQPFTNAQLANIKSFTLNAGTGNTYTASGIRNFKSSDNAVGDITTAISSTILPNAFQLDNQEVIAFDNTLPTAVQNLSSQEILNLVAQAQWTNPYTYVQPIDVAVKSDDANLIFAVRETGNFERREGYIMGQRAFRFTNKIFTEKYAPFSSVFDKVINTNTTVNLLSGISITNPDNYNIISNSEWFAITNGILSFPKNANKPINNYGVIYFLPKASNIPPYRMRVFTHRASANTISQYFSQSGTLLNKSTYIDNYYGSIMTSNIPLMLYLPASTNLRATAAERVPPPTAGTEE
jgi:hypothetical protein